MTIYIITYDLRSESTQMNKDRLDSLIKEEGSWACLGSSSYLVESEMTAKDLRDRYKQVLDCDDMLYIGEVTAPAAWHGYSNEVSDWIRKKLQ